VYISIFIFLDSKLEDKVFMFCWPCISPYNRGKKNQLDAQLILSIFHQPLYWNPIQPGKQTVI